MTNQQPVLHAHDVEITCTPGDGILEFSVDTVAALDLLAVTLRHQDDWVVRVNLPDTVLTARPAHRTETTS